MGNNDEKVLVLAATNTPYALDQVVGLDCDNVLLFLGLFLV